MTGALGQIVLVVWKRHSVSQSVHENDKSVQLQLFPPAMTVPGGAWTICPASVGAQWFNA